MSPLELTAYDKTPGASNVLTITPLKVGSVTIRAGVTDGTTYVIQEFTVSVHNSLPAPGNLQITEKDAKLAVSWDSVTGAKDYQLNYRLVGPDQEFLENPKVVSGTNYEIADLTNGMRYIIRVWARTAQDANGLPSIGEGTPRNPPPTIAAIEDQTAAVGRPLEVAIDAMDADDESLRYRAVSRDTEIATVSPLELTAYDKTPGASNVLTITPLKVGSVTIRAGVTDGTTYVIQEFTVSVHNSLPAPGNLQITEKDAKLAVSWDSVTGAKDYQLNYRLVGPDQEFLENPKVVSGTNYEIADLTNGMRYIIRVWARTAQDANGLPSIGEGTPRNPPPTIAAIEDQTAAVGRPLEVAIDAMDADDESLRYWAVSRDTEVATVSPLLQTAYDGTPGASNVLTITPLKVGSVTIRVGVTDGTTYVVQEFTVSVHNSLPAPGNLQITEKDTKLAVSWDSVTGATGYQVQYRLVGPDQEFLTEPIDVSGTNHEIADLTNGMRYIIRVWARTAQDANGLPSIGEGTPRNPPPTIAAIEDQTAAVGRPLEVAIDAMDADDESLRYRAVSRDTEIATVSPLELTAYDKTPGASNVLTITPLKVGSVTIRVGVTDGTTYVIQEFTVSVRIDDSMVPDFGAAPMFRDLIEEIESRSALAIVDDVTHTITQRIRNVGTSRQGRFRIAGQAVSSETPPPAEMYEIRDPSSLGIDGTYAGILEPTTSQWFDGTSFVIPLQLNTGSRRTTQMEIWGQGSWQSMEGDGDLLNWEGSRRGAQLGLDARLREQLLAGLVVSWSDGSFDYKDDDLAGAYDNQMLSVHPWVAWTPSNNFGLWASLGYGEGEFTIEDVDFDSHVHDTTLKTASAGASGTLLKRDAMNLVLKGEGHFARVDVRDNDNINVDASRVRIAVEGNWLYETASGSRVTPSLEVGMRADGGDGSSGTGAEIGAGLEFKDSSGRLSLDLGGRVLVTDGDVLERGLSGVLNYAPDSAGHGLSLNVRSEWGTASSGIDRLWETSTWNMTEIGSQRSGSRMQAELGYGIGYASGLLTSYTGVELGGGGAVRYRIGSRHTRPSSFELSLEGTHDETSDGSESGIILKGTLRW